MAGPGEAKDEGREDAGGLRVRGLRVRVADRVLLDGVDLSVRPGESLALAGPSGSGKTTLLRSLAGLVPVEAGEITLGGRPPAAHGWPAYRRAVMALPQGSPLGTGTVRDALALPFTYAVADRPFPEDEARELLRALRFPGDPLDQAVKHLSGGEGRRVSLARALLCRPRVLLADEPTAGLDEAAVEAVREVLEAEGATRGMALVLVAHDAGLRARCDATVDLTRFAPGAEA